MRSRQLFLISGTWPKKRFAFGGDMLKNSHAKTKRPFAPKLPIHVVIRSSRAHGKQSLLAHERKIARILDSQATRGRVRIGAAANAGNHLHLMITAPSREHLAGFLRGITGRVAMAVTGAKKGKSAGGKAFWDARPFTRIVGRGRDQNAVTRYLVQNSTEVAGFSRLDAKEMFRRIGELISRGNLPRSPNLIATGFS